jgi:hypothetical protein
VAKHCSRLKHLGVITKSRIMKGLTRVVRLCRQLEAINLKVVDDRFSQAWKTLNARLVVRPINNSFHDYDLPIIVDF